MQTAGPTAALSTLVILVLCGCAVESPSVGDPDAAPREVESQELTPSDSSSTDGQDAADAVVAPAAIRVMTFNVLCFFCNDIDYDPWEERLLYFGDLFARHAPDLVGLQELLFADEVAQVLEQAPGYAALFFQDDTQPLFKAYADATILYRTDRFELVDNGFYWLSETPDVPLSGGWADTNLARLVAWAHLRRIEDGQHLTFASTHFDNNPPNQEMSAPLFVQRTREQAAEMPVIVVGDFNSKPASAAYAILAAPAEDPALTLKNTFDLAETWAVVTNQEPPPAYDPNHRIDHLFVAGEADWRVSSWDVDMTVYGPHDRYPSDHFAMVADIHFRPRQGEP